MGLEVFGVVTIRILVKMCFFKVYIYRKANITPSQ